MGVVYELYDKDIAYDSLYNTQEEKDILEFIKAHKNKKDFESNISKNYNVYIQNELSNRNTNLINWYPIEKGKKVLEVLGRFGTITEYLVGKDIEVTTIETIKSRAEIINERIKSDKLKVVCTSNILQLDLKEKYDVIILPNVIENAKAILNQKDISAKSAAKKLLLTFKKMLADNGKIIISTNNKFGIRNFAGYKQDEKDASFSTIVGKNTSGFNRCFSKKEILDILREIDASNYKFYYPLPDCRNVSVIYSDDYLPTSNSNKLKYNICYDKYNTIIFNETDAIMQVTKSGYFDIFANSFIIEVSNEKCKINFVGFNNFRDKKYQLITSMQKDKIVKISNNTTSKDHIKNIQKNICLLNSLNINTLDSYDSNNIISKYTDADNLDTVIFEKLSNEGEQAFINEIDCWYNFILEKLEKNSNFENIKSNNIFKKYKVNIDEKTLKGLNFAKTGFLDIVFENIFVIDGEYYIYDQEWYEENVPFEFILYRAIQNLYFHNSKIQYEVAKEELLKKYNLEQYLEIFEELEKKWQDSIIDKETIHYFETTYHVMTTLESLKNRSNDADFYYKIINSQNEEIEKLKNENMEMAKRIQGIESSRVWRAYKKIFRRK